MDYIKAFIVGGLLCVIGQVLLQRTKLTPARIVVIFVTAGAVLTGIGVYGVLILKSGTVRREDLPAKVRRFVK